MPNLTGVSAMPRLMTGIRRDSTARSRARRSPVARRDLELRDDLGRDVVLDGHAVRRDVARRRAVQIGDAHVERIAAAARARSRRSRARSGTCPAGRRSRGTPCPIPCWSCSGSCAARRRAASRRCREWNTARSLTGPDRSAEKPQRDASVRSSPRMRPSSSKPTSYAVRERVALAGRAHVVVAVEAQLGRAPGLARDDGGDAGEERHLRFLAAEAAAHPPAFDDDVVRGDAERVRDHVLHFARMLRRRVDLHAAVLARHRQRDLAFEIEVVLAADAHRAAQPMRRARQRRRGVAARHVHRRQHVRLRGQRVVDGQDRGQRLEVEPARASRRAARCCTSVRRHGEHRLPGELDDRRARRSDRRAGSGRRR